MIYLCDTLDGMAITGGLKWGVRELTWRNDGVRYPDADFEEAMEYVVEMVSRYCSMDLRITAGDANIVSTQRYLDGTNGVLARQELPGRNSLAHEQLTGTWDSA